MVLRWSEGGGAFHCERVTLYVLACLRVPNMMRFVRFEAHNDASRVSARTDRPSLLWLAYSSELKPVRVPAPEQPM